MHHQTLKEAHQRVQNDVASGKTYQEAYDNVFGVGAHEFLVLAMSKNKYTVVFNHFVARNKLHTVLKEEVEKAEKAVRAIITMSYTPAATPESVYANASRVRVALEIIKTALK